MVRARISQIRTAANLTQMHALIRRLIVVAAAFVVTALIAQPPLLQDNFNDQTRTNWLNSSTGTSINATNQNLSISSGRHALAYFTSNGTQQTLGPNESITVSFSLTFSSAGSSSTGFRVGLFDSQLAARPTTDGVSTVFKDYDGYLFSFAPAPTDAAQSNNLRLRVRTPSGGSGVPASTALLSTLSETVSPTDPTLVTSTYDPAGTRIESVETAKRTLQVGTPYSVTYIVSRSAGSALTFSFSLTDGTINFGNSFLVSSPTTSTFDAFAIYSVSTNGSSFAIDDVNITAVPEPSTYAACAGAAVLGLAFWRRRRAAAKALAA